MRSAAALSWESFFSTYLPAFILALGAGIALPALPALAGSFGVGFALASGVITAFLLGSLASTIPSGYLLDHVGRRPVLLAGPLLSAAIAFLVVWAHSFPELLVLRFFNGFAAQTWVMARLTAIAATSAPGQRGRLITWLYGMDNIGKLTGPVVGGVIATAWGLRAPFLIYAILALLALIPIFVAAKGDHAAETHERRSAAAPVTIPPLHLMIVPRLPYFIVALFAGLTRGPVDADLLHLYAAFEYHLTPAQVGYLATTAALVAWPIGLLGGWILDHFGRRFSTIPGFLGIGAAMAALAIVAAWGLPFVWYVALFLGGIALYSLSSGSIQTLGTDIAPPQYRGAFLGVWRFVGQGGGALGPIVFALLANELNYASSFLFMATTGLVVGFVLIRYIPNTGHEAHLTAANAP